MDSKFQIPNSKFSICKALFDIKPVDNNGRVNIEAVYNLKPTVDLKPMHNESRISSQESEILNKEYGIAKSIKMTKKAPTEVINTKLMNSVGAAYSTVVPVSHPVFSLSQSGDKLSGLVDNQKSRNTIKQLNQEKLISQRELEKYINANLDIKKELRIIGTKIAGKPFGGVQGKPRVRPIFGIWNLESGILEENQNSKFKIQNSKTDEEYQSVLAKINERIIQNNDGVLIGEPKKIDPISLGILTEKLPVKSSPEIERWARYIWDKRRIIASERQKVDLLLPVTRYWAQIAGYWFQITKSWSNRNSFLTLTVTGLVILAFVSLNLYGVNMKSEIVKESNSAATSLEEAKENLELFDFEMASNNFAEAYGEFSKAGDSLNFMGAGIASLFAELPGFDKITAGGVSKLKSATNLIEVGKLLSEAGESVSEAVNTFKYQNSSKSQELKLGSLKVPLLLAQKNLLKVEALLADVDSGFLPEDKQQQIQDLNVSRFKGLVNNAIEYTDFLENFAGYHGIKKYLILFQNNSELRPTGGFPGSYAVITFNDGKLTEFFVDDIYNLDGQLKENIIPPTPLQHITPIWGMRDAGWFIHFPTSAQKAMEFFKKEAGYEIDGVITINPDIVMSLLKIVGSIEMSKYGLTLNGENFLSTIQAEVEYGDNREQPKSVLVDMAPKLIEKITLSNSGQWFEIFSILTSGLSKKDILMYFKDLNLEKFVTDKKFGGLIKNTDDDYLMVTFSNIKGSKTDTVTDNYITLDLQPTTHSSRLGQTEADNQQQVIKHKLTITRQHNGGNTEYGFYNKQNPAYVRVLVPEGAKLLSISGNSIPQFKPLIKYSEQEFRVDKELSELESGVQVDENSVSIYRESGKAGFAFWLITDPGKSKTVELEYSVPFKPDRDHYGIYIQKQPGLEVDNLKFKIEDSYIYNGEPESDLEFKNLKFKDL